MPSDDEMITARAEAITPSLVGGREVLSLPATAPLHGFSVYTFVYIWDRAVDRFSR